MENPFKAIAARRLAESLTQRSAYPMTGLEADFLPSTPFTGGARVPDPEHITWEQLYRLWNPPKAVFSPSEQWLEALRKLQIPANSVHLGSDPEGILLPPFSAQNLSNFASPKTGFLVGMVTDLDDRGVATLQDIKGEACAYLHPKVMEHYNLRRGSVLLLTNCAVLPEHALNVTLANISDVVE
jgi:hypothetical protein